MSRTSARIASVFLVAVFLATGCANLDPSNTVRRGIDSGEVDVAVGMSKEVLLLALKSRVYIGLHPLIVDGGECGQRYFPEEKIEILYPLSHRLNEGLEITYFVFTGVSQPRKCTRRAEDLGDGELSQWFHTKEEFNQFVAPLEANQEQNRIAEEQKKEAQEKRKRAEKAAAEKRERARKTAAEEKSRAQRAAACATGRQPRDQEKFMRKLGDYALSYDRENNEIRKSRIFNKARAFDKQFFDANWRSIENWIARVGSIDTVKGGERASLVLNVVFPRQGGGMIAEQVLFAQQIETGFTMYGSYYTGGIAQGTPIYNVIGELNEGDRVVFSAREVSSEGSTSEVGAMKLPEYSVVFTSIQSCLR